MASSEHDASNKHSIQILFGQMLQDLMDGSIIWHNKSLEFMARGEKDESEIDDPAHNLIT